MSVNVPGQPGIIAVPVPGLPGPPGGSVFEYTQAASASTWIINHSLGRKLHVTLFNSSDEIVYADVVHGSVNQTTVTFPTPTTGSAVLS